MKTQKIKQELEALCCPTVSVKYAEPLARHTTFKIGGPADFFVQADSLLALQKILVLAAAHALPILVLGGGSNLLVADKGFKGMVLKLGSSFSKISSIDKTIVTCGAWITWKQLILDLMEKGVGGLEFGWGIPGTLGGALVNNAGTANQGILDCVQSVRLFNFDGTEKVLSAKDLKWGYRFSSLRQTRAVITEATLKLARRKKQQIKKQLDLFAEKRKKSQPQGLPNAGSIFKNPVGHSAGALIEESGCKGLTYGGAMVSDVHANFIVNRGKARAEDVRCLIYDVQKRVKDQFGILLELEIELIGF